MVPDLTLEVIYYNTPTDFKLEFSLCGVGNVRLLSAVVSTERAFLLALQRSVGRSRVVITVGGLNPQDHLLHSLSRAIGAELTKAETKDITNAEEIDIPRGSIPLFSKEGKFQGVVIEQGSQSIIMLSEDKALTHEALKSLILPYLQLVISKKDMPLAALKPEEKQVDEFEKITETQNEEPVEIIEPVIATTQPESIEVIEETLETEEIAETEIVEEPIDEDIEETLAETTTEDVAEEVSANEVVEEVANEVEEISNCETEETNQEESQKAQKVQTDLDGAFIKVEDIINPPQEIEDKTTDELLRNIVLKKMNISEVEFGSHDKFINPNEEALFVEEELYVGKHSKKQPSAEAEVIEEIKEPTANIESPDGKENSYEVSELPSELDTVDELSYKVKPETRLRKVLKAILAVILVILVIIGSFFGYRYFYQPIQGQSIYESILSLYGQSSQAIENTNIMPRFGKLYELNNQLVGFVSVPNSEINYPVVKTTPAGAMYCQTHLFDGTFNGFGTPYTFNSLTGNSYNRNVVIYGNTVSTGEMFSNLAKYTDIQFYRARPVINFDTLYKVQSYKVFSIVKIKNNSFNFSKNKFFDDAEFLDYLNLIKSASLINTSVDILGTDNIVTLVTEDDGEKICVFARLVRDGESPIVDVSQSSINTHPEQLDNKDNTSDYNGGDLGIAGEDNVSDGRNEETIPNSSKIEISASDLSSSPSSPSSTTQSNNSVITPPSSSSTVTSSNPVSSTPPTQIDQLPILYVTNNSAGGAKVSGTTLEILSSIVEAEMGSGYEVEALKAQAVCKYSWLLCEEAHKSVRYPGVAMKTPSQKTINAVKEVLGVVVRYNGKVAQTFCYAFSAGYTANATDLWGGSYPWVRAVDSSVDKNAKDFLTVRTYAASDIAKWVKGAASNLKHDIDLTKIADKNSWLVPEYDSNNLYATWINIGGVRIRGSWLRTYVLTKANCGAGNDLRSPAYTVVYNEASDSFTFTVKGYGHGAGLSQFGANQYAKQGWNYEQILNHYFTGIDLGISYGN